MYCLDRLPKPTKEFYETTNNSLAHRYEGSLHYKQVDVQDALELDAAMAEIAEKHSRMDGLIAAAGVQNVTPALDYPPDKITEVSMSSVLIHNIHLDASLQMMNINYGGVFLSAVSCARQMIRYNTPGSIVLVGSMSGLIANKGFTASVYNSSKAAVVQLGRSLAMEWGQIVDGRAIRVNVLCPGNIMIPVRVKRSNQRTNMSIDFVYADGREEL